MNNILSKRNIHTSFHIGLILKGLFDLGEILCGVFLIFLTPERMNALISLISKGELSEDPNDFVMNYLVSFSHTFSIGTQHFSVFYLLSHGILKILILFFLWGKKLWAYPLSCLMLMTFIVIQVQRFTQTHSFMLMVLTLIDIVMIALTILEYKNIKADKLSIKNI